MLFLVEVQVRSVILTEVKLQYICQWCPCINQKTLHVQKYLEFIYSLLWNIGRFLTAFLKIVNV